MATDMMQMSLEQKKEFLRSKLPEFVSSITEPDKRKKGYYKCPLPGCGSGHEEGLGHDGAFSIASDKKRWRCFSCGRGGDIFELIGYVYSLKNDKSDRQSQAKVFRAEYEKAMELFGSEIVTEGDGENMEDKAENAVDSVPGTENQDEAVQDGRFREYLENCKAKMPGSEGYTYLTGRGFSGEVIERFSLGYDPEKHVITIPYSNSYSYYATRSIEGKEFRKPNSNEAGPEPIFHVNDLYLDQPCFVCESQLDAVSIAQAGGLAVAMGGTGAEKLIKALKSSKPRHCLILCLDNDNAGKKSQKELAEKLDELGIDHMDAHFSLDQYPQPQKDANDLLKGNPDHLAKDIQTLYKEALDHELETGIALRPVGDYQNLFKRHRLEFKQSIRTGFTSLDIALGGGFAHELYIMSAETGTGKSAITACIAQNVAESGVDVLYFALEMGRDEFIARGASMISREKSKNPVPYGEILNDSYDYQSDSFYRRNYTEYEPYVDEYMQRYGEHLYFIEGGLHGKTAMDIAGQVEAFKKEHDVRRLVIIVDYLQLLKADPEDRAQRDAMSIVSAAVVTLKSLASQYGCTVFAITSMSNAQKGARVTDSAGKYSGDISYTAGVFLGWNWKGVTDESKEELRREEIQQCKERGYRVMILEVLKQRSGERDREVEMFYYPAYNYLTAPAVEGKSKPHKCENRNQKRR